MNTNSESDIVMSENMQYYEIYTLIDITDTNVTDINKSDTIEYNQTQNLNLLFQIIGLRTQPINPKIEVLENQDLKNYCFSKTYRGKNHKVWKLSFYSEHSDCWKKDDDSLYYLKNDIHSIAITTGLTETAKIKLNIFDCFDKINICFKLK